MDFTGLLPYRCLSFIMFINPHCFVTAITLPQIEFEISKGAGSMYNKSSNHHAVKPSVFMMKLACLRDEVDRMSEQLQTFTTSLVNQGQTIDKVN